MNLYLKNICLLFFIILVIAMAGCKKNYRYNPSRSVMLGNYHYLYINYETRDTARYNITVSVPSPDDGNSIYMPDNGSPYTTFGSTDSSFTTYTGGHDPTNAGGNYKNDSIFIQFYDGSFSSYTGGPAGIGVGVKY